MTFEKSVLTDLVLVCARCEDKALRHQVHELTRRLRFRNDPDTAEAKALLNQLKETHHHLLDALDHSDDEAALSDSLSMHRLLDEMDRLTT